MFNLNLIIGAVVAAAVFGVGMFSGYKIEAAKVERLETELKRQEDVSKKATASLASAQQEIDQKLAQKDVEFKQKMDALQQDADAKRKNLEIAMAESSKRMGEMKNSMGALNAKLKEAREQLKNAAPGDQAALQSQIDILEAERKDLKSEFRGEACKDFPVPKQIIDALNGVKS